MWNSRATNWVQTINHSLLHATKLRYLISFLLGFWFISSLYNKLHLKCPKCPSTISFFRLLRIFQSLLIQVKKLRCHCFQWRWVFPFLYPFSRLSFINSVYIGKTNQEKISIYLSVTMFLFTYEVTCYSLQKKTKRWRL